MDEAEEMFTLCHRALIEKTRYEVSHDGLLWLVDYGENRGLVLAEVELEHPNQPIAGVDRGRSHL